METTESGGTSLEEQLLALKLQLFESQDQQQRMMKRNEAVSQELLQASEKVANLQTSLAQAEQVHQDALRELTKAKQEKQRKDSAGAPSSDFAKGFSRVFGKDKEADELKGQIEALKGQVEHWKRQASTSNAAELGAQNEALKQSMKHLFKENQTLKDQLESANGALAQANTALAEAEAKVKVNASASVNDNANVSTNRDSNTNPAEKVAARTSVDDPASGPSVSNGGSEPTISSASSVESSQPPNDGSQSGELSAKLLVSIKRKDEVIRQREDDLERLMSKLNEKETELMQYREKLEVEQRERKAAGPNSGAAMKGRLDAQVKTLTDALGDSTARVHALEQECEELKGKLFVANKSLADAQTLLASTEDMNESQKRKVAELSNQLLRAAKDREDEVSDLKTEMTKIREKEAEKSKELEGRLSEAVGECIQLKVNASNLQSQVGELRATLVACKEREVELERVSEDSKAALSKAEGSLHELRLEQKVEEKKRNRLVKELRTQLKIDAVRVRELEAALAESRDGLETAQQNLKRTLEAAMGADGGSPGGGSSSSGGSQGGGLVNSSSSSSIIRPKNLRKFSSGSPVKISPSPSGSNLLGVAPSRGSPATSTASSDAVEMEVSRALSTKLEEVLNLNHTLKTKCFYLEQNIRLLNEDVLEKKAIIANLIKRVGTGTLAAPDPEAISKTDQNIASSRRMNMEEKEELFRKTDLALHQTVLENISTKENLKKMGQEVTRLLALIAELEQAKASAEDERDSVKEMIEELKKERGLP